MKQSSCGMALVMTGLLFAGSTVATAARASSFTVNGAPSSTAQNAVLAFPFQASTVAGSPSGTFVVAWSGSEGTATNNSIHVRVYRKNGTPLTDDFVADLSPPSRASDPESPEVAVSDSGHFVVAWDDVDATNNFSVVRKARLFSTDGTPLTGEFCLETGCPVDPEPDSDGPQKKLVMDAQGNFVAAWVGGNNASNMSDAVLMRRFAADGTPLDAKPVTVTSNSKEQAWGVAAAIDAASGDYVIAWEKNAAGIGLGISGAIAQQTISAQRFNADGKPTGLRMDVGSCTALETINGTVAGCDFWTAEPILAVTLDAASNTTVLWWKYGPLAGPRFYAHRYGPAGVPKGAAFVAAVPADRDPPFFFSAGSDGAGDLMLLWTDSGVPDQVFGQRVKANNKQDGGVFQVSGIGLDTRTSAVAADAAGDVFAAWIQVQSQGYHPPESDAVLGELFTLP